MVGRQQLDDEGCLVGTYSGCFSHAEEVLQQRGNPWLLAVLIMNLYLASALQAERFGRDLIKSPNLDSERSGWGRRKPKAAVGA